MQLSFLGAARTVTGSRFLLDTGRARVLIDCGMFQGAPHEVIRNRVPLGFDPRQLDAIVLTHAHLDHCGLLPVVVAQGFGGSIHATDATVELTGIVLRDSAKLQEEFAARAARRAKRDPARAARYAANDQEAYDDAVALSEEGAAGADGAPGAERVEVAAGADVAAMPATDATDPAVASEPEAIPTVDPEHELRNQPPEVRITLDEPLYTTPDVERTTPLFRAVAYGEEREVAPGVHVTLYDAGHILGSGLARVRVEGGPSERETVIVFSGDLGRPGTPIIRDPTPVAAADFVVCESTYGGREHEPQAESIKGLADSVIAAERDHGVLLIPSFAIGRTQEIVWELDRLLERDAIPELPLYLDSPMASKASDVYRRHPEAFDQETYRLLLAHATPLDYPNQIITNDAEDSKKINVTEPPFIVISSNGMLTGGRVLHHLGRIADDPRSTLLFVGYQGEGTLGAHLMHGERHGRIDGRDVIFKCAIKALHGFSAHSDDPELRSWLSSFIRGRRPGDAGVPKRVFLTHGDPPAQEALAPKIRAMGFDVHIPKWHETVVLA